LMLDGVEFRKERFVVALGIDKTGSKTILGYHQGPVKWLYILNRRNAKKLIPVNMLERVRPESL